jgi:uncharacterized protein
VATVTDRAAVPTPIQGAERMDVLDAVRGAALLGILLINIIPLSGLLFDHPPELERTHAPTYFLLMFLVEGKFYSLFSFLFGVGFAVFVSRASARGADARRLFKRRLSGLLIIGIIHTLFIWMGDILATYALLGFALIPFLGRDDRTVLKWAGAMLFLPIPLYGLLVGLASLSSAAPPPPVADAPPPPILLDAVHAFATGSYADVVRGNAIFTLAGAARRFILMFFPRVFGMFLLGFYVGRRNVFADPAAHATLFNRVFVWGMVIGLPFSFWGAMLEGRALGFPTLGGLYETTVKTIGVPTLALGYAAGFCLLFQRLPRLRRAFAPVGQLALTSYISHSIAALIIFYGIGFGLFGRVPLVASVVGALAFFALQAFGSRVWLTYATFGPCEWLWRMYTYRARVRLFK